MKESKLVKLCSEKKIPFKKISQEKINFYRNNRFSDSFMVDTMSYFDNLLKGNIIVIGGFCAGKDILGFKKMRKSSNDLDCVINEAGFDYLVDSFFNDLFLNEEYKTLFLEYKGIPIDFDLKTTHGWEIPENFYSDSVRINVGENSFNSISPEFLISLKSRRSILKKRFYGKDAIDTINILVAPEFRKELKEIDFEKLTDFFKLYSMSSFEILNDYLAFLESYKRNLGKKTIPFFSERLFKLRKIIKEKY